MTPALKVKVLSITSPSCISVRPLQWEKAAYTLQEQLSLHYTPQTTQFCCSLFKPIPGIVCVARYGTSWYRAVVVQEMKGNVTVRLVDQGKVTTTDYENILPLAPEFLSSPGFAICCHLYGMQPRTAAEALYGEERDFEQLLPASKVVTLVRRGVPVQGAVQGQYSLPVDLTWEEVSMPDPFLPNIVNDFSFTELCAQKFGLFAAVLEDEDTVAEDMSDEIDNEVNNNLEFSHVEPLQCSDDFHWLDPELPSALQFTARGTFVDESGQIYLQQHSSRHTVRVLRNLLNEKFSSSSPDMPASKLRHMQDCCTRWRDGNWYRARFIRYLDIDEEEGLVVLVDYGNMFRVKEDDIRRTIYGENIPIQCLCTVLAGVSPEEGFWSQECLDFMQEKINYARLGGNHKLRVNMKKKPESQPLVVDLSDYKESKQGVVVDLAQLLTMLPGEVIMYKQTDYFSGPFRTLRKSLYWGMKEVPAGYYKEKNPYLLLLCPQAAQVQQVTPIPNIDWSKVGLIDGLMIHVKLVDIVSHNCVYVQPHPDTECEYLSSLTALHSQLADQVQDQCEVNPPVLQPRPGLPVAVRWGEEAWYRAVIKECTDSAVFVTYVDYGTKDWLEDSMMIKEMPEEWGELPALAIPLQLAIEPVEADLDILTSLVMESLWTCEEDLWMKVECIEEEGGGLKGHLLNRVTGNIVYKGLAREGVLKLM